MTHAMLFTGVDVVDGAPRRWRVENSWGDEKGDKGFYTMNDSWFDEYVFEIAARRDRLPQELQAALDAGADRAAGLGPDGRPGGSWSARGPASSLTSRLVRGLGRALRRAATGALARPGPHDRAGAGARAPAPARSPYGRWRGQVDVPG